MAGRSPVHTLRDQLGPGALALHARVETRALLPAAVQLPDAGEHARGAVGQVRLQPACEQRRHLPGQAQHGVEQHPRAVGGGGLVQHGRVRRRRRSAGW